MEYDQEDVLRILKGRTKEQYFEEKLAESAARLGRSNVPLNRRPVPVHAALPQQKRPQPY